MKISSSLCAITYSTLTYIPKTFATTITTIAFKIFAFIQKLLSSSKREALPPKIIPIQSQQPDPSNFPQITTALVCTLLVSSALFFLSQQWSTPSSISYLPPKIPLCYPSEAPPSLSLFIPGMMMGMSILALPFRSQQTPKTLPILLNPIDLSPEDEPPSPRTQRCNKVAKKLDQFERDSKHREAELFKNLDVLKKKLSDSEADLLKNNIQ